MKLKKTCRTVLLLLFDLAIFVISFYLAFNLRIGLFKLLPILKKFIFFHNVPFTYYFQFWHFIPIFIVLLYIQGFYTKVRGVVDDLEISFKTLLIYTALITFYLAAVRKASAFSRMLLVLHPLVLILIFPVSRYFFKKYLHQLGLWQDNVIILGAGETGKLVAKSLKRHMGIGLKPLCFLDDDPKKINKIIEGIPVKGNIQQLPSVIKNFKNNKAINSVIVAIPGASKELLNKIVSFAEEHIKNIYIVPDLFGLRILKMDRLALDEVPVLKLYNAFQNPANVFIKRAMDLVLSTLALILLSPLFLLIAIAIKLDDPKGPVFFKQWRIGKNGKKFRILKFRTMFKDAEERLLELLKKDPKLREEFEKYKKLKNDPRITRIGKILRKYSLDELPQLINVLLGQMSLVGPRPLIEYEMKSVREPYELLKISPGLTGYWQISGRSDVDFETRIRMELFYVRNWSIWLDIYILIETIPAVLKTKGAY